MEHLAVIWKCASCLLRYFTEAIAHIRDKVFEQESVQKHYRGTDGRVTNIQLGMKILQTWKDGVIAVYHL